MASSNPDLGSEGPQTDVAVRKALYYGMDREQLSKLAFFDLGSDISPSFALPERDADFIGPSIQLAPLNAQPESATAIQVSSSISTSQKSPSRSDSAPG